MRSLNSLKTRPDLVLATKDELVESLNVGEKFCNSDHYAITFAMNFSSSDLNQSKEKSLTTEKQIIVNWDQCSSKLTGATCVFTDRYLKTVKECIPMRNRRPQNFKSKWWNKQIAECLRAKKDAHNKNESNNNNENYIRFMDLRCKAERLIKQSIRSTEMHVANQSKTSKKEFFGFSGRRE